MNVQRICSEGGYTEGPVIRRDGSLAFVSIDEGRVYAVGVDRQIRLVASTGGGPNGLVEGKGGILYVAQNGGKWPSKRLPGITGGVQRIDRGGNVEYITQDMVSPNDLCFGPDGLLYVTDPTRVPARDDGRIWRCDPASAEAELLISLTWYPNGIGFSFEDDAVYVADTTNARIVRFTIGSSRLVPGEDFARLPHNVPDGFAFDVDGNLLVASPDPNGRGDLQVFDREGRFMERVDLGDGPYYTNVAIGADHRVYITDANAGGVLLLEDWPTAGLPLHPFRAAGVPQ